MSIMSKDRRKAKMQRRYLTPVEVSCLIRAAAEGPNGLRDRAMCQLAFAHGLRVSELIRFPMYNLHLQETPPRITVERIKGSLSTEQKVSAATLTALNKWLAIRPKNTGFDELFLARRGAGQPFTRQAINYLIEAWGERAAFPFRLYPHMLRHSCGYDMVNQPNGSRDLRAMQEILGHKDIKHTAAYTALACDRDHLWGM